MAGKHDITSAAQAAEALKPIAGSFAFILFAMGIIGTGLLAVPVLAGSAAYAVGEPRGWVSGLEKKPFEAVGFYTIIALATLLGVGIDWSGLDPIKALVWSAVINGMVAAPVMAAMMIVVSRKDRMGQFIAGHLLLVFGWGRRRSWRSQPSPLFSFTKSSFAGVRTQLGARRSWISTAYKSSVIPEGPKGRAGTQVTGRITGCNPWAPALWLADATSDRDDGVFAFTPIEHGY